MQKAHVLNDLLVIRLPNTTVFDTFTAFSLKIHARGSQQRFVIFRADLTYTVYNDALGLMQGYTEGVRC